MRRLLNQIIFNGLSVRFQLAVDVGDNRERRIIEFRFIEFDRQFLSRRVHQSTVERRAHRQDHRSFCAHRFQLFNGIFDRLSFTGDHRLTGAIEINRLDDVAGLRDLIADINNLLIVETENRRHCSLAHGNRFLHELPALVHE